MAQAPVSANPPAKRGLFVDIALGGIASSTACIVSNPFETVKVRFQLQRELSQGARLYNGILDCFTKIYRNEGIRGLQAGLGSGIMYQIAMNATRLGMFETLSDHAIFNGITRDVNPVLNFCKDFMIAASCGGLAAWVASPIFVVKTRLQTANRDPNIPRHLVIGHQYGYKNTFDGIRQIYRQGGIPLLYRNSTVSASRVFFGGGTQLACYGQIKSVIQRMFNLDGTQLYLVSSAMSSFIVTLVMNPFDVVTSRMNNQNQFGEVKYKSAFDCFTKTYHHEGPSGLFKGFSSHYLRLAPHVIITFILWEKLKQFHDAHIHSIRAGANL